MIKKPSSSLAVVTLIGLICIYNDYKLAGIAIALWLIFAPKETWRR